MMFVVVISRSKGDQFTVPIAILFGYFNSKTCFYFDKIFSQESSWNYFSENREKNCYLEYRKQIGTVFINQCSTESYFANDCR